MHAQQAGHRRIGDALGVADEAGVETLQADAAARLQRIEVDDAVVERCIVIARIVGRARHAAGGRVRAVEHGADQVAIAGAGGIRGARQQEFAEFQGIAVADELAIDVVKVDHVRHGGGSPGGGQGQDGGAGQALGGVGTCCGSCLRMHDTSHEFSLDDYVGCNMFCVLEALSRAAG